MDPTSLTENDWRILVRRIHRGECTPFLGAGACYGLVPTAREAVTQWVKEYGHPLKDTDDLASAAQYLAVTYDPSTPKEEFLDHFIQYAKTPTYKAPQPHAVLANLQLPIYITTNYDSFMMEALRQAGKDPHLELCQWNSALRGHESYLSKHEPTPANPIVFHLHGHHRYPHSLVLTEDDYLDFLVNISRDKEVIIPRRIEEALALTSLLFIGYSLRDWNFRVLFRGIIDKRERSLGKIHIAVQLPPEDRESREYLNKYFGGMNVRVYWGPVDQFFTELQQRLEDSANGTA